MVTASREFQVMAKPAGAVCNLDCSYCYYLNKSALYPNGGSLRMTDDLLERYIVQHIEACPKELIVFEWHGGEPTILGARLFSANSRAPAQATTCGTADPQWHSDQRHRSKK